MEHKRQRYAVGNDLVFVPGFAHSLTELFKTKTYTSEEISYCDRFDDQVLRYASTWAAKEAVYKAFKQIDPGPLSWKNIAISREKIAGRPHVRLLHIEDQPLISLSISHDGDYTWAVAIIETPL